MAKAIPWSSILILDETRVRIDEYEAVVRSGHARPGARLAKALADENDFTTALLRTKLPQIFAESAVAGDGSDWNMTELGLLGDISAAMDVTETSHHGRQATAQPACVARRRTRRTGRGWRVAGSSASSPGTTSHGPATTSTAERVPRTTG